MSGLSRGLNTLGRMKMCNGRMRTGLLTAGILIWGLGDAAACSWIDPLPPALNTILSRKTNSQLTVHGVVLKSESGTACGSPNKLLSLKVKRAFGSPAQEGDTIVVATAQDGASCGVEYPAGMEVVLFANPHPTCTQPTGQMWTYLMNRNVPEPAPAQVDSLYGVPPVGIAKSLQGSRGYGNAGAGGSMARSGNAVVLRDGLAGTPCRADGRTMKAIPNPGK